uniref:Uncharacterized protein n=1 Tax=Setaria viridis TaxID=4556 RepID=A0A4U6WA08_SETVI|nr:hypothetical protein SEVIR_1G113380v2 [Setaria viridis]
MDLPGPIHEILVLFGGFILLLGGLGVSNYYLPTQFIQPFRWD